MRIWASATGDTGVVRGCVRCQRSRDIDKTRRTTTTRIAATTTRAHTTETGTRADAPEVKGDLPQQLAEDLGGRARLAQQRQLVQQHRMVRSVYAGHIYIEIFRSRSIIT